MFDGPLLLCLRKSANLCYKHTDQPLSATPYHHNWHIVSFTPTPHPRYEIPAPPGTSPCVQLQSRLPPSLKYLLPPQSQNPVWNSCAGTCPLHVVGWLFFSLFQKIQETSLEWSRLTQCCGHFPVFSTKKSPEETSSVLCSFFPITATLLLLGDLPTPC